MKKRFGYLLGGFFFFALGVPAVLNAQAEEKEVTEAAGSEQQGPHPEQFVKFHPMLIPVIQRRVLVAAYSIDLVLEAPSVELADEIRSIKPTVRDALLTDIYSIFSLAWDPKSRVHLTDFKRRLLRVAQKAGGKSRVKDILIQSFQQQKSVQHRGFDYRH